MNRQRNLKKAISCFQSGNLSKAEDIFRKIVNKSPDVLLALRYLGLIAYQKGDHDAAVKYMHQVLELDPSDAKTHNDLGFLMKSHGLLDNAIASFQRAISHNPVFSDAMYNLGNAYHMKRQFDRAIEYYRRALQLDPQDFEALNNLGNAFKDKGYLEEAKDFYVKALMIKPDFGLALNNLGTVFQDQGQFEDARQLYRRTLDINPGYVPAHNNMGISLLEENRLQESLSWFEQALALDPEDAEAHWNIAIASLLIGNFDEGWKKYEWRFRKKDFLAVERNFSQPRWDGKNVKDLTILLYAEQGMGDAIQFIRYAPLLAEKGARVIVECQKELISLVQGVEGVAEVIEKGKVLPAFDRWCPLLSLPLHFGTTLETIPTNMPYFKVKQEKKKQWQERVRNDPPGLRVGLAWAGNPAHRKDRQRSCPRELFRPLARLEGTTLFSLQKGESFKNTENLWGEQCLIDHMEEVHDFSDTAALIENIDLVISVDTAVAHLAGALGKNVWVLLPHAPDWRWLLHRSDNPWYPTMRLFRQPKFGDWDSVIKNVLTELRKVNKP